MKKIQDAIIGGSDKSFEILRSLVNRENVNSFVFSDFGRTLVNEAAYFRNFNALLFFIELGGDVISSSHQRNTPLHNIISGDNHAKVVECVQMLLKAGAETTINLKNVHNHSPIFYAVTFGDLTQSDDNLIDLLLSHGADVTDVYKHEETRRMYEAFLKRRLCRRAAQTILVLGRRRLFGGKFYLGVDMALLIAKEAWDAQRKLR